MAETPASKVHQLIVGAAVGAVVGIVSAFFAPWQAGPLLGWGAVSLTWVGSVWPGIAPSTSTRRTPRPTPTSPTSRSRSA